MVGDYGHGVVSGLICGTFLGALLGVGLMGKATRDIAFSEFSRGYRASEVKYINSVDINRDGTNELQVIQNDSSQRVFVPNKFPLVGDVKSGRRSGVLGDYIQEDMMKMMEYAPKTHRSQN